MDNLVICARCGSDACYVEEVNMDINTYFCYGCGFQSNSLMKEGEEFYENQVELLPELYKELLHDDGEKIWMPSAVNLPEKGMVFANGPGMGSWGWSAVKAVEVSEEDKEKYPIPGKKGQFYKFRMDMGTRKDFVERDYMEALSYIGVLPE